MKWWTLLITLLALSVAPSAFAGGHGKAADHKTPAGEPAEHPDPAHADPAHADAAHPGDAKEAAAPAAAKQAAEPAEAPEPKVEPLHKAKIAIMLNSITKLELGPGTFQSEFGVVVTCAEDDKCKPDFEAANGKISSKELVIEQPGLQVYRMKGEFGGTIDLQEYPFDRHDLSIQLYDKKFKTLLELDKSADGTKIDNDVHVPGWTLKGWDPFSEQETFVPDEMVFSSVGVNVQVERPRLASFFKTLVPLAFMIIVAGFTLLLKPKSAAGRLAASTGGLMTLVMFHISSTSSLPPLGYMTRLDKFMVATYFVYMLNILFSVAIVRFDEAKNEKLATRFYHLAQGAVPGMALLMTSLVFARIL